ncbi:hypothetical protein BMS3Bbin02_00296 [bacterium BMS3Bbin02]|nr:hypothetical protein BMS3Bbin02_00296 [bacterium BMS3Bbin02]
MDGLVALRGERIRAVRYLIPSSSDDFTVGTLEHSHEASTGIELETYSSVVLSLVWKMQGVCEGLAIGIFPASTFERARRLRAFDVTSLDQWQARVGSAIVEVGAAWHVPADGCPLTLWSLRLMFDSGTAVTICLGEQRSGVGLCYMPDSVLAIFDRSLAESFWSCPGLMDSRLVCLSWHGGTCPGLAEGWVFRGFPDVDCPDRGGCERRRTRSFGAAISSGWSRDRCSW